MAAQQYHNTASSSMQSEPVTRKKLQHASNQLIDPLHHTSIKAHLASVNQEISLLDTRIENVFLQKHHHHHQSRQPEPPPYAMPPSPATNGIDDASSGIYRAPADALLQATDRNELPVSQKTLSANVPDRNWLQLRILPQPKTDCDTAAMKTTAPTQFVDLETEHIYETIPEDAELEPIYCSPCKNNDSNLVEQWLKMNSTRVSITTPRTQYWSINKYILSFQLRCQKRSSLPTNCCSKTQQWGAAGAITTAGTTAKSNSSSLEDPDNSSSAYNTGGSCNSNTLTLELNVDDTRTILASDRNTICRSTLVLYPPATPDRKPRQPITNATPPTGDGHIKSNQRQIKSPKHAKQTVLSPSNQRAATGNRIEAGDWEIVTIALLIALLIALCSYLYDTYLLPLGTNGSNSAPT